VSRFDQLRRSAKAFGIANGSTGSISNLPRTRPNTGASRPIESRRQGNTDEVCVAVIDHGIGIAPEAQERIFGRFERPVRDATK